MREAEIRDTQREDGDERDTFHGYLHYCAAPIFPQIPCLSGDTRGTLLYCTTLCLKLLFVSLLVTQDSKQTTVIFHFCTHITKCAVCAIKSSTCQAFDLCGMLQVLRVTREIRRYSRKLTQSSPATAASAALNERSKVKPKCKNAEMYFLRKGYRMKQTSLWVIKVRRMRKTLKTLYCELQNKRVIHGLRNAETPLLLLLLWPALHPGSAN